MAIASRGARGAPLKNTRNQNMYSDVWGVLVQNHMITFEELEMASRNGNSGLLKFKNFWVSMPPDPPTNLLVFLASPPPPPHKFLQSWPKCVGHFAFYAEFLQYSLLPPPPCNVGQLLGGPFLLNDIAWGERGMVGFGPKNVCSHVKNDRWLRQCILQECPR